MDSKFKFENFKPSNDLRLLSDVKLGQIMDYAPSDSTVLARVVKRRDGFESTVEIFSKVGYFVARSFEQDPDQALQTVKNRIESKLSQWKSNRFLEEECSEFDPEHLNNPNQQGESYGTHIH